jgi:hypothetical protein
LAGFIFVLHQVHFLSLIPLRFARSSFFGRRLSLTIGTMPRHQDREMSLTEILLLALVALIALADIFLASR